MWVAVTAENADGSWLGTVANLPLNAQVHQYRHEDPVHVVRREYAPGEYCWEPLHPVNPAPSDNPVSQYSPQDVFAAAVPPTSNA